MHVLADGRPLLGRRLLQALPHQLLDVAAAAEGLARPGHHHHVHVLAVPALGKRRGPCVDHGAGEGVAPLGPVERDRRDALLDLQANLVAHGRSPPSAAALPEAASCAALPEAATIGGPERRAAAPRSLGAQHLPPMGLVAALVAPGPEPLGPDVQVVLGGVADGAMHLMREAGDRARRLARPRLGGAEGEGVGCLRRRIDRCSCRRRLACHLGQVVLDRLEACQRPAELHAIARITDGHVEHLLHRAPQLGGAGERHEGEAVHLRRQDDEAVGRTGKRDVVARLAGKGSRLRSRRSA